MPKPLTPRLEALRVQIEGYARDYGLDFFPTVFEVLSSQELNMVASYGGFPTRYPHWRWGMEYEQLSKGYDYGVSKIYELVINNDPTYAYLMESNTEVDQKLVMSHVFGHADFFKNNFAFAPTHRRMIDQMANHATRVRRWIDRIGVEKVEDFIDRCLSLENLIDQHAPFIRREPDPERREEEQKANEQVRGFEVDREYMRGYINPSEFLESQRRKVEQDKVQAKHVPERPRRDVLTFLLEHAPLETWEADILAIIRDEAHYFAPQGQTKIMNEGWASYWHSTIMTQKALRDAEVIDYADRHAGTMGVRPGALNPYKLGIELFRDIEDRWNKGRFGKEWEECDSHEERSNWDRKTGQGREKIFEVRRHYNDITFIDTFLTPEFCIEQKLFTYGFNEKRSTWEITAREFKKVKDKLLQQLTNFGQPIIEVVDANHENRGELLLAHRHDGQDLEGPKARETLVGLHAIWKRPVNVVTRYDDQGVLLRFDGQGHSEKKVEL
ncbi:MAG TPA: SpoVR family protein [Myxococcaceae bacterium]|nr:SpoVR family protein [Myxococcaceae bacterium]